MRSTAGHVVLAPDKFKGSLSAERVCDHLAVGLRRAIPGIVVRRVPVADGGEGTVEAAVTAGFAAISTQTTGPTGEPIEAVMAIRGRTAVIEVAQACGQRRLPGGVPAPLTASSYGVGLLIRAAVAADCTKVILGLGGSACTDGGAGMVQALGALLLDAAGRPLAPGGSALRELRRVDLAPVAGLLAGIEVIAASDVDNPLLGVAGAAAVFGPQKGANPAEVKELDAALARWSAAVVEAGGGDAAMRPGAGAAGGLGFAVLAVLGGRLCSGIDLVLDLVGFDAVADGARLVVTGEGSLDQQSLHGKVPIGVAQAAARLGIPVVAVAGECDLTCAQLADVGIRAVYTLTALESDVARCIADPAPLLERIGERVGRQLLVDGGGDRWG